MSNYAVALSVGLGWEAVCQFGHLTHRDQADNGRPA